MTPAPPPAPGSHHAAPPRSDTAPHPPRFLLEPLRPLARRVLRQRWEVEVHGAEHVPGTGPVIFASNHIGIADGPILTIFAPRPVHSLTKVEMFSGGMGRFLHYSGQVPLDRFNPDPRAVRTCLRVLREGRTIGIFPEGRRGGGDVERFHRGAAYFGMVTGAPVVPVAMLGTRRPGGHTDEWPARGSRIDLVFGPPEVLEPVPWPRTREQLDRASLLLREHLRTHLEQALAATGRSLPGPLPATEVEPDPATGVTEQGAP